MIKLVQIFSRGGSFFLFVLLEILCLYLIITRNGEQREVAMATWSLYTNELTERYDELIGYISIREQLEQIKEENARLRAALPSSFETKFTQADTVVEDSLRQRYSFLPANIVSRSQFGYHNTLVLDIGRVHGVEPHQGVICSNGVLGFVTQVTNHYCRVMTVLHRNSRLSAGLRKNNEFGTLLWEGRDARYMQLTDVPSYVPVAKGDTVETTGYSNYFPTGIALGTVDKATVASDGTTWNIKVELLQDLRNVQHASVVRDLFKGEVDELQE